MQIKILQSLEELLESVNDFENRELNNLRDLADELKSNPHRNLVVHSFEVKQEVSISFFYYINDHAERGLLISS